MENNDIFDVSAWIDSNYGAKGTPEREQFDKEAYEFCVGQLILKARRDEKVTQQELAKRVGTTKSYISRIENGLIEPGVTLFFKILEALNLRFDIVRPMGI